MTDRLLNDEMDCRDFAAVLSAVIDDELDPQSRHIAERHLTACSACTRLYDATERANDAIASSLDDDETLPHGFVDAVLDRTVHTRETIPFRQPRIVAVAGWVAAAAMFVLAASLFFFENVADQGPDDRGTVAGNATGSGDDRRTVNPSSTSLVAFPLGPEHRSATNGGYLPKDGLQRKAGDDRDSAPTSVANAGTTGRIDQVDGLPVQVDRVFPPDAGTLESSLRRGTVSRDDEDTIYAATNVLDMLFSFEMDDMRIAERMRDIVVYDELLPRLEQTRLRMPADYRPTMLAAESILYRIVHGPVNADDLNEMRRTASQLEILASFDRMIGHTNPNTSM